MLCALIFLDWCALQMVQHFSNSSRHPLSKRKKSYLSVMLLYRIQGGPIVTHFCSAFAVASKSYSLPPSSSQYFVADKYSPFVVSMFSKPRSQCELRCISATDSFQPSAFCSSFSLLCSSPGILFFQLWIDSTSCVEQQHFLKAPCHWPNT